MSGLINAGGEILFYTLCSFGFACPTRAGNPNVTGWGDLKSPGLETSGLQIRRSLLKTQAVISFSASGESG